MSKGNWWAKSLDVAVVGTSLAVATLAFKTLREPRPPGGSAVRDTTSIQIKNWQTHLAGQRSGSPNAPVQIVVFGGYQCPACQRFEPRLRAVVAEFADSVALVYRHLPFDYHPLAYNAARAAECAGAQGRFDEYHGLLYEKFLANAAFDDFVQLASAAGVTDTVAFGNCASSSKLVATIERDLTDAKALGIRRTPTVIINGLHLGSVPDNRKLQALIREYISASDQRKTTYN